MKSLISMSMHKAGSSIADIIIVNFCEAKGYVFDRISKSVSSSPLSEHDHYIQYQEKMTPSGVYYGMARGPYVRQMNVIYDMKAIVQVRDPRDCITSAFFSYRESHVPPTDPKKLDEFEKKRQELMALDIDTYAVNNSEGYRARMNVLDEILSKHDDCLLLKYEDMVERTDYWLEQIADFLEQPLTVDLRAQLGKRMSFNVESESPSKHKRQVKPGDHLRKLKPETISAMNETLGPVLDRFGYPLKSGKGPASTRGSNGVEAVSGSHSEVSPPKQPETATARDETRRETGGAPTLREYSGPSAAYQKKSYADGELSLRIKERLQVAGAREFLISMNITPEKICSEATFLAIEGMPRSGSSYLVGMLNELNQADLHLSHHTHRLENLLIAEALSVPLVVLIREPLAAIVSMVLSTPKPIAYWALRYAAFYRTLKRLQGPLLLLRFEDLIADPAFAIRQISSFAPALPLRGSLSGAIEASAARSEDRVRRRLIVPDGGSFEDARATYERTKKFLAEDVRAYLSGCPDACDVYQSLVGAADL